MPGLGDYSKKAKGSRGYKMKGFSGFGPIKEESIVSAKKEPYVEPVESGSDEPKKIAYSRRTLNPTIKEPKTLDR